MSSLKKNSKPSKVARVAKYLKTKVSFLLDFVNEERLYVLSAIFLTYHRNMCTVNGFIWLDLKPIFYAMKLCIFNALTKNPEQRFKAMHKNKLVPSIQFLATCIRAVRPTKIQNCNLITIATSTIR